MKFLQMDDIKFMEIQKFKLKQNIMELPINENSLQNTELKQSKNLF